MKKLPNLECAVIPPEKLRYCLDPNHPTGRDKARVFRSALGLGPEDAARLEGILRQGIANHEARLTQTFPNGAERWVVAWVVSGRLGPLRMVSAWNVDPGCRTRLISCYLKKVQRR